MLELEALEVAFELADFYTIGVHCVFNTVLLLVDLLDDDLGVTVCW
jgi:hypothetical protein